MTPWGLLNTRPAPQNARLTTQLEQAGFGVVECPALQIVTRVLPESPSWSAQDVWVFVSRNAVTHFAQQLAEPSLCSSPPKLIAVGAGTAEAIQQQGWPNLQPVPTQFDSEGMLALDALALPKGLRVGIVRGDGGRELLAQTLTQQGAKIAFYEVYQRIKMPFCKQAWLCFQAFEKPVMLFTSQSSMAALLSQLEATDRAWCLAQRLIVFSQRIADFARENGFSGPIWVTRKASDQAIVDALMALADSPGGKNE